MERTSLVHWMLTTAGVIIFVAGPLLHAQDPAPESSSKPAEGPRPKKPDGKKKPDSATHNAPDQPAWDPLRAEKDLEVGQYYMRKGDVDAAIDRFQDATTAKPGYAIPFRYLGEAQEKRGLRRQAIASFWWYLTLSPKAGEGKKTRKKTEKRGGKGEQKKK